MLALLALDAHAYALRTADDGSALRWEAFPIEWSYVPGDEDPEGAEDAVRAAFDAWEAAGSAVSFVQVDGAEDRVWFDADGPFDADVLAATSSWATDDGELVGFTIRVNPRMPWSTDGAPDTFDLQAAITHEIGHALGLDHSAEAAACMYEEQAPGDLVRRELDADDLAAVRDLYPLEAGLGCSSTPAPASLGLVAFAFLRRRLREARPR